MADLYEIRHLITPEKVQKKKQQKKKGRKAGENDEEGVPEDIKALTKASAAAFETGVAPKQESVDAVEPSPSAELSLDEDTIRNATSYIEACNYFLSKIFNRIQ